MTIANELSSEVAAALLEAYGQDGSSSAETGRIRDVIVAVHSTLRNLKAEARRASEQQERPAAQASSQTGTASG